MSQNVVNVPTMVGYVPPSGYKVISHRELPDGTVEVTLEPPELISATQDRGGLQPTLVLRLFYSLTRLLVNEKACPCAPR